MHLLQKLYLVRKDTSAAENASGGQEDTSASSTTIQKDTSASKKFNYPEDTSASGSTTAPEKCICHQ